MSLRKKLYKIRSFIVAKLSNLLLHALTRTCHIHIVGLERFCQEAQKNKCILMLWHNRLAIVPFILSRYTNNIHYAALVSGSRDGDILSFLIHSYKNGKAIRAPHLSRHHALREIIRYINDQKYTVIITPDGPRGPRYEMKPGTTVAALETQAQVFSFNWIAKNYWELKTWDRLRIPKPFSHIYVEFGSPVSFDKLTPTSFEEANQKLKTLLSQDDHDGD